MISEAWADRVAASHDLVGLIATTAPNVFYLTGLSKGPAIAAAAVGRWREPGLALPVELADFALRCFPGVGPIVTYGRFIRGVSSGPFTERDTRMKALAVEQFPLGSLPDALSAVLEALGLTSGRVGYDDRGADAGVIDTMRARFPRIDWAPAFDVFRRIRRIKSPEEVRRLRRAAEITERAMEDAIAAAQVGMTVADMVAAFDISQIRQGAAPRLNHVSFGTATAYGMVNLDEQPLAMGDLIRFDAGCSFEGYASDLARTVAFGGVTPRARNVYHVVAEALEYEVSLVQPGVRACEVFDQTMTFVRRRLPGFERTHVGHGQGLTGVGYDQPLIGPSDDTVLEPGMVLCLEVPYYELGLGGLQPEDAVVITEAGCDRLNPACPTEIPEARSHL